MTFLERIGVFLRERQRWVLIALLLVLHLTLLAGADSTVGLMCWVVNLGLFILWQPFIQAERRMDSSALTVLVLVLVAGAWLFGWWLLIGWVAVLTALLGGRVLLLGHRPTRIFYLLAFAYLLCALLVWLLPRVVPSHDLLGPSLDIPFAWGAPLLFVCMMLLPHPREIHMPKAGMVDFFYSLFMVLLISVLVLGSLAFMLLRQALYVEAVFKTLVSMAAMLLLIAWMWNPRPGFSGIGVFLSRYLLTIGLPFETWLQRLMESAALEGDPERFLHRACARLLELPWVSGGCWAPVAGAQAGSGVFGQESHFRHDFANSPLLLTLYTRHKLSPALLWHFSLMAQLTNEYYVAKVRARELQQMSYLRAVHETGARLTHDVKNLLQSLNNLCYMAQVPDEQDGSRLTALVQRQLPQITQRLHQTLEKLQVPQNDVAGGSVEAEIWWSQLRLRYANDEVVFWPVEFDKTARVPATLFDSVADNLLQNALVKRQSETGLAIDVRLAPDGSWMSVCDNGTAVNEALDAVLLNAPVPSENGLGIGLYHAARQAGRHGYALRLIGNSDGKVCFELRAN